MLGGPSSKALTHQSKRLTFIKQDKRGLTALKGPIIVIHTSNHIISELEVQIRRKIAPTWTAVH